MHSVDFGIIKMHAARVFHGIIVIFTAIGKPGIHKVFEMLPGKLIDADDIVDILVTLIRAFVVALHKVYGTGKAFEILGQDLPLAALLGIHISTVPLRKIAVDNNKLRRKGI